MHSQYDREEKDILERFEKGEITRKEMRNEIRELQQDYRAAASEAAENAYHDELERW